jgi:hypothetical protein
VARLFISYRAADGRDKATALARDLGESFGDAQVFLDKEDLRGGVRWREAISAAIAERPVLLPLWTPQLLAATDEHGALRISDIDDPVRHEVESALAAGAHILPLPCDDLTGEATAPAVGGNWFGELVPGERLSLSLRQVGEQLALTGPSVDIRQRPDWNDYRKSWREQSPDPLDAIAYRGHGESRLAADGSTVFGVALEGLSSPGETLIDSGNLRCTLTADGALLDCQLWLNRLQTGRPVRLSRLPPRG